MAKALIGRADRPDDRVPLEELAAPFVRHLCEHLKLVDKQATSRSSKFLDACRAFNRGELSEDALVGTMTWFGFVNVVRGFHVVGSGRLPVRFFRDERNGSRDGVGAIRLPDSTLSLVRFVQVWGFAGEADAPVVAC